MKPFFWKTSSETSLNISLKTSLATLGVLAAIGLCSPLAGAEVATYAIVPGREGTEVEFLSKATLESFTGHTDQIRGRVVCDPDGLADSIVVYVEVDLATLETGMGLRDKHMRENHLETDQYPHAIFRGARILSGSERALAAGEPVDIRIAGEFALHGVRRPLEVTARVTRLDDDPPALAVECAFEVKLADHQIDRPKFLMMKVSDTQRVTLRLLATQNPATPTAPEAPSDQETPGADG